jgi:DNA-binding response OmpR family regulator
LGAWEACLQRLGGRLIVGVILVVDDNPSIREILEVVLAASDYRVRCAESGKDALALLEKERPRLIILDLSMPDMSGYEVLERIQGYDPAHPVPVVCLSALPPEEEREHAISKGACDYVSKPFNIPELLECVRMYARQRA